MELAGMLPRARLALVPTPSRAQFFAVTPPFRDYREPVVETILSVLT